MTPQETKYLKYTGIAVALGGLAYLLFGSKPDNGGTGEDPTGNGSVIDPNTAGGVFNATKVANDLYEELRPVGIATWISGNGDERDNIFAILKNVSQTQFGKVVTAFGKKVYNANFNGTYFLLWETPTKYDLPFILKKELQSADFAILKQKYPLYL